MPDEQQSSAPDEQQASTESPKGGTSGQPGRVSIDPKELEGLSPAERAALYKARQREAGITPPRAGEQPPATAPAQPAQAAEPSPPKPAAPPKIDPKQMEGLSPAERAALYKQRLRESGFVPPQRAEGAPEAPAAKAAPKPVAPAPKPAAPAGKPAAPAKPAEPEPDPEEVKRFRSLAPELSWERVHGYVEVTIPAEQLLPIARLARDELGYDYLSAVTAVDTRDDFLVIYHLYGFDYQKQPGCLVLQVRLPREAYPSVDSVASVWPGADFQEREVWDLMGIRFLGHPDLRRILLADDFPGHPLRKDFVFDYEYVLVRHLRYGVDGQNPEPYTPPHEQIARAVEGAQ